MVISPENDEYIFDKSYHGKGPKDEAEHTKEVVRG
jgi:hypothetical protein